MQSIMERRQSCFNTQCIYMWCKKKVGQTKTYLRDVYHKEGRIGQ